VDKCLSLLIGCTAISIENTKSGLINTDRTQKSYKKQRVSTIYETTPNNRGLRDEAKEMDGMGENDFYSGRRE